MDSQEGGLVIYFTSDTHFGHDKNFIWQPRGFSDCNEMNECIVRQWNEIVHQDDEVYHLGDIMLGPPENIQYLQRLTGRIHIICGNHDTDARIEMYKNCQNVEDVQWADRKKINGYWFYLSHFPSITANNEKELKHCTINLYGHTHQSTNFFQDYPFMYHVGVDSHNCKPISIVQIIEDLKKKKGEI